MPFIIPHKRKTLAKSTRFSSYKTVEESPFFVLQERKQQGRTGKVTSSLKKRKFQYRIITKDVFPFYECAKDNDLDRLKASEWAYIVDELPAIVPAHLDPKARLKWLIAHFTVVALERNGQNPSLDLVDSDDEESDIKSAGDDADVRSDTAEDEDGFSVPATPSSLRNRKKTSSSNEGKFKTSRTHESKATPAQETRKNTKAKKTTTRTRAVAPATEIVVQPTAIEMRGWRFFLSIGLLTTVFPVLMRDTSQPTFVMSIVIAVLLEYFLIVGGDPFSLTAIITPHGSTNKITSAVRTVQRNSTLKSTHTESSSSQNTAVASSEEDVLDAAAAVLSEKIPIGLTGVRKVPDRDDMSPNDCCDAVASTFNVRVPPNYAKNKTKGPSEKPFFGFVGVDVFKTERKLSHVMENIRLPEPGEFKLVIPQDGDPEDDDMTDDSMCGTIPPWLVVNMMVPDYAPSFLGRGEQDGEGWSLVMYFKLTKYGRRQLSELKTGSSRLLKTFWDSEPDDPIKVRMKCIPAILNHEEVNFGRALTGVLKKFNAKPFLTQPCHAFYKTDKYYEIDVDTHTFCWSARQGAHNFKSFLVDCDVDIGWVVEGWGDDEQPEQLLGCCRICKVDPHQFDSLEAALDKHKKQQKTQKKSS